MNLVMAEPVSMPTSAHKREGAGRVLVVDDSQVSRSVVHKELEAAGYEFRDARHGRDALAIIDSGFIPDLVILDVVMPELDGFGTCGVLYSDEYRALFSHLPDGRVPVIFFTGSDNIDDRRRGFELGALDFVPKNFEAGALARRVRQILEPGESLRNMQVLLADESRVVRAIVAKALRSEGVQVHEAEDGLRAFELLCNRTTEIDLVISNIEMRGLDGPSLCRRVRRELGLAELPFVFLTSGGHAQRIEAFHAGATDCLSKPFIREELIARVAVHIETAQLNRRLRHAMHQQRSNLKWQNDMLATLSHDMRSPLSGIMGFADHLLQSDRRPAAETENLTLIKQSGQMILSLVEDILSLAKHEAGTTQLVLVPTDVADVARRSVAALHHLADHKHITLAFTSQLPLAVVAGDAPALLRVFNNLISNSVKFTPAGGSVQVRVSGAGDNRVALSVIDSGIGIAPESIPHLFDRFSRLSRPGTAGEASTGLGMTIVKQFIEAHNGAVEVVSAPGKGTTFRILLPLLPVEEETAAPESKPESRRADLQRRIAGLRILVADDNPVNQMVARAVLSSAGCVVDTVGDGKAAFEHVIAAAQPYDGVLMDIEMPLLDGISATSAIRTAGHARLPIVALTGHAEESVRHRCLEAGMSGFLEKPINPTTLLELIGKLCAA